MLTVQHCPSMRYSRWHCCNYAWQLQPRPFSMGSMRRVLQCVLLVLSCERAAALDSPWLYPDAALAPHAMRVTTLGSGSPDVRKEQAASGFLVELGNEDKFLFDLGTGAYTNLWATGVPLSQLTKVFLTHLHSDHIGDLVPLYIAAMWGRTVPWEVWGPSGETAELGTAAAMEALRQFLKWDTLATRRIDMIGRTDDGDKLITHEFDYSIKQQVVYEQNGVKIISTPVHHYNTSGPVAYRLEWHGLVFTYSGDTRPTPNLIDIARQSDLLVLQSMGPVEDFASLSYESQVLLNTSHITPEQAGDIFQAVTPRLAVAHHLTVNEASRAAIITAICKGYPQGDLIINEDLLVYEVTAQRIQVKKRLVPTRSLGSPLKLRRKLETQDTQQFHQQRQQRQAVKRVPMRDVGVAASSSQPERLLDPHATAEVHLAVHPTNT